MRADLAVDLRRLVTGWDERHSEYLGYFRDRRQNTTTPNAPINKRSALAGSGTSWIETLSNVQVTSPPLDST
jgi:hypothetical protein